MENENTISIADDTTIAGKTEIVAGEGHEVKIGEHCLFSKGITVRTGDAHSIIDTEGHRLNYSQNVAIGDRVWITQDVKILKGSSIGDDTVIAAGAVVTGNFSNVQCTIIGGIPGKVIKTGVKWISERI